MAIGEPVAVLAETAKKLGGRYPSCLSMTWRSRSTAEDGDFDMEKAEHDGWHRIIACRIRQRNRKGQHLCFWALCLMFYLFFVAQGLPKIINTNEEERSASW